MARPIKFLHAADLHLGASFIGAQLRDEKLGTSLREAVQSAYMRVIDTALDEQVDFVCLAGDLFNAAESDYRAQGIFIEGLRKLDEADIPVYLVTGNHDPLDGSDRLPLPKNTHCFDTEKVEEQLFEKDGVQSCAIYGRSYPYSEVNSNYAQGYKRTSSADNAIGILHTNIGTASAGERYARCELSDLKNAQLDYWALGHIHLTNVLSENRPCIVYAGSPQALNINETGKHGCYVVELDRGSASYTWHNTNLIEMVQLSVNISDVDTINDVRELIKNAIVTACPVADSASYLVRITLTGVSHLDEQLDEDSLIMLYDSCHEYLTGPAPHVHLDSKIVNETTSDVSKEMHETTNEFLRSFLDIPAKDFLENFDVKSVLEEKPKDFAQTCPQENDELIATFSDEAKLSELYNEAQELLYRMLAKGEK